MVFYEIPVDIQAIFFGVFLYSTSLKARGIQKKNYQKITRISPEFHKNTWYNCIILQLFDFHSS